MVTIPSLMLPFALVQLFYKRCFSDLKGRFAIILLGLSIFGVRMIIASLSFSLMVFLVANVLGGIGFGFVNPVLIALLTDITPGHNIWKKIGVFIRCRCNLGVGLGPLLGGQIIILGGDICS